VIEPLLESLVLYLAACSSVRARLVTGKCSLPITDSVDGPLAHNSGAIQRLHDLLKGALLLSTQSECQTWPGRIKHSTKSLTAVSRCPLSPCAQAWPMQRLHNLSTDPFCSAHGESIRVARAPKACRVSMQCIVSQKLCNLSVTDGVHSALARKGASVLSLRNLIKRPLQGESRQGRRGRCPLWPWPELVHPLNSALMHE